MISFSKAELLAVTKFSMRKNTTIFETRSFGLEICKVLVKIILGSCDDTSKAEIFTRTDSQWNSPWIAETIGSLRISKLFRNYLSFKFLDDIFQS